MFSLVFALFPHLLPFSFPLLQRGRYVTSPFHQFKILASRSFKEVARDKILTKVRFGSHIGMAVLIGLIYLQQGTDYDVSQNVQGELFFAALFLMLGATLTTVLT